MEPAASSGLIWVQLAIGVGTIGSSVLAAWWVSKNKKTEIKTGTTVAEKNLLLEGNDELIKNLTVTVTRVDEENKILKSEIRHMKNREAIFFSHMYTMDRWANKAYDQSNGTLDPVPSWPKELTS